MPWKKGAVEKNTAQEDGQSPVKWEKSDGKKFLKKELWNLDSAFQSMSIRDIILLILVLGTLPPTSKISRRKWMG
jgi:hypothetical protein